MKKPLLLVVALSVMLGASGNSIVSNAPQITSEEKPATSQAPNATEQQKPVNKDVVTVVLSDSTLQNRSVSIPKFEDKEISYTSLSKPEEPKKDTVKVAADAPKKDSVQVEENIMAKYPNRPFKRVVLYHAGRNRYGRFSEECAAHANYRLQKAGIPSCGHAYQIPSHFPSVINGYSHVKQPKQGSITFQSILAMHRRAADYVKANLDISKLNPFKYYVVNMYYTTSPHMSEFFYAARRQQTGNYGTHVGVLYYDKKAQAWVVEHNIHGNVYRDALVSILGGTSNPYKYGITSISRASK